MSDSQPSISPNLQDLGDYLQGLAQVLLARDQQRQTHEASEAAANRQLQREAAERAERQRVDELARTEQLRVAKVQQDRADAVNQLQLLRLRSAHLVDQAPAVRAELDELLANPDKQDPCRLLPEVRKELDLLPKLLEKIGTLQAAGMDVASQQCLLPKGQFQVGVALQALEATLNRVPSAGLGRYVKIGAAGEKLPAFAAQWVAFLDTASGLMWENKTEGGLHSRHSKFTNYGKDEAGDSGRLVAEINRSRFAGHSDWRMPTKDELIGLARAADRGQWSPNDRDFHWSSSAAAGEYAWNVYLDDGYINFNYRGNQYGVRVVRAGQ